MQLSQKERMLLEDQKKHEQLCIQKYQKYANEAQDPQLQQVFQTHAAHELQHYDTINQIMNGQVPNLNTSQQQQGQPAPGAQAMQSQTQANAGFNQNDGDLATDMLTTEKFISGAYDTAIFEFQNANVRQALNHIQKEEQEHGQDLFNYLQAHGMYNVQ